MKKLLLFAGVLISFNVPAQKLSTEEKNILAYVQRQMPQTMQLLQQLVDINSGTLNVEGVKKVGAILRAQFDRIGFTTEWISLPDSMKRAGHLVANIKGSKGRKLFLIGHMDTVFEPDMPANPYRVLDDSTATGQGVNDMKGGNVIILAALEAIQRTVGLKNASVTAYFTGDEEDAGNPSSVSRADFINRAKSADIALGFEGAQGLSTVATARRGASGWILRVSARQAHSSGIFQGNYGAIYEAARILTAFREKLGNQRYLTFNPGIIAGGSEVGYDSARLQARISAKTNIIAPSAIVHGDLRFLREAQKDSARMNMKAMVNMNNLPGTTATISFEDGIPSMEPTKANNSLVFLLDKCTTDLGMGRTRAGDPGSRGAGDISYVAKYLACLDGLGASGKGAHAPGETLNLKEFPKLIERAAIFIYRLTR
ncbi:MAG: M20/M25/M40 family metallo-hydrolase [Chitinophagaceae bacterium]